MASSFTRAMFTWRKVFSSNLVSSASRVPDTGTVLSTSRSKKPCTAASEASSMPETTFGVFSRRQTGFPGSIRSGLYPRWKSAPARSPDTDSRIGPTSSSVVPG